MPELDRLVAGIRCREVLADLSDFVDQVLPTDRVRQIEAHLQECDWCERFGGEFSSVIAALRRVSNPVVPLPTGVDERLHARLRAELSRNESSDRPT